jgi:hypothetical protein
VAISNLLTTLHPGVSVGLETDQGHELITVTEPATIDRVNVAWTTRACIKFAKYSHISCTNNKIVMPVNDAVHIEFQ